MFLFSGFRARDGPRRDGPRRDGPGEEQGGGRGCPAGSRERERGSWKWLSANFQPFDYLNFQSNQVFPD